MLIKICGITRIEDGLLSARLGAWAIGLIFVPSSPRMLSLEKARVITEGLGKAFPSLMKIGVFLDQSERFISQAVRTCSLDGIQFHGNESPGFVLRFSNKLKIKAFVLNEGESFKDLLSRIELYKDCIPLLDLPKDRNTTHDILIDTATKLKDLGIKFIVAGGIGLDNIDKFLQLDPFAIDISRGVETSPGIKDSKKLERLFDLIRRR